MPILEPEIFNCLPFEDYADLKAVNSSSLKALKKSPLHYLYTLNNGQKDTESLRKGRLVHMAILEPDKFEDSFILAPEVNKRTKAGRAEFAAFMAEAEKKGQSIIEPGERCAALDLRDAIYKNKDAAQIVTLPGYCEMSFIAQDPMTELFRKCRTDKFIQLENGKSYVVDLKTCEDATPEGFSRTCAKFDYEVQAAFYLETISLAIQQTNEEDLSIPSSFVFIAIEKKPPFAIGIYQLTENALAHGKDICNNSLLAIRDCMDRKHWPGPTEGVRILDLPAWAYTR